MTHDTQTCTRCRGTGRVPLGPEHQATLDAVRSHGQVTPMQLSEQLGVAREAMCNRLATLARLGLVHVERVSGKQLRYSVPVVPGDTDATVREVRVFDHAALLCWRYKAFQPRPTTGRALAEALTVEAMQGVRVPTQALAAALMAYRHLGTDVRRRVATRWLKGQRGLERALGYGPGGAGA